MPTALGLVLLPVQESVAEATSSAHTSGHDLFLSSGCSHCHTIDGVGGTIGPNLSGIGRRWKTDMIRGRIEQGTLEMPPYKDVLSDSQIQNLVHYLHTRRSRKPTVQPAPVQTRPTNPSTDPN